MTDNYQFAKSNLNESVESYSPFIDKQWNYIPDINSNVYQNNGLTLVQWDLASLFNSSKFLDLSECYITLPIVMVAGLAAAGAAVAPNANTFNLLSLKSNFVNLIHQGDIQVSGQSVEQIQPFLSVFQNFRMLSEMSQDDIKAMGKILGFSSVIDTPTSSAWNGAVQTVAGTVDAKANGGNGYCNNFPYPVAGTPGTDIQLTSGAQNLNVINRAIQERVSKYYDVTNNVAGQRNGIYGGAIPSAAAAGTLGSVNNINSEYKCFYSVQNGYACWSDVAVIRLGDIFLSMKELGLMKRFDGVLRLYVNTGSVNVIVTNPNNANTTYQFNYTQSTFTNLVPFTINFVPGALPATTSSITAGCFITKPVNTNYNAYANLAASNFSSQMNSCRLYYSQIVMNPEKSLTYLNSNRNKEIVYRSILYNSYSNIQNGASWSQLVNGGIKNLIGVLIVPMISSTILTYPQYASPFDTFGATYSPLSLINVNATVGGTNLKNNPEIYTFENFIEEVSTFEKLTSADFGVSVGLIDSQWWEWNRVYYLSARSTAADDKIPRALSVTFQNNSQVPIDVMVFTIYLQKAVVDVSTGILTKEA